MTHISTLRLSDTDIYIKFPWVTDKPQWYKIADPDTWEGQDLVLRHIKNKETLEMLESELAFALGLPQ